MIKLQGDNTAVVQGAMTFATVRALYWQGHIVWKSLTACVLDLSEVTVCDSAGLALLIEWKRQARAEHKTIQFKNIPDQLQSIARISNAGSLL